MKVVSIKIPHIVSVVALTAVGAFIGYFAQKEPGSLVVALAHWNTAEPILLGGVSAAIASIYPLIQHSIIQTVNPSLAATASAPPAAVVIPPPPPERNIMGKVIIRPLDMGRFLFAPALALLLSGCVSAAQAKAATDTAGAACSAIFSVADPALAPLCTSGVAIAEAVEALIEAAAKVSDGGVAGASAKPTDTQVYGYLLAHGAVPVKK